MDIEEIRKLSELEITRIIARDIIGTKYLEIENEIYLTDIDDEPELFAPLYLDEHTFIVQRSMLVYGYKIVMNSIFDEDLPDEQVLCFRAIITLKDNHELEFTSPNLNRLICLCAIWAQQQVE